MPRLYQLRDLLAELLALRNYAADRHCRKLQQAGLLPASTSATIDAEHAATFLLAAMAARSPGETLDAAETYGPLPLLRMEFRERLDTGSEIASPPEGAPADLPEAWKTLGDAVAFALAIEAHLEINLKRSLTAPFVILSTPADPSEPRVTRIVRMTYGRPQPTSGLLHAMRHMVDGSMEIWAGLPVKAVQRISSLLAGNAQPRPPVEARPQTAVLH